MTIQSHLEWIFALRLGESFRHSSGWAYQNRDIAAQ